MADYNYQDKRIIYPNDEGGVSVVVPSPNCELSLEQIAGQAVPIGKPYQIVNVSDIPSDREYRNAWTYEEN